MTVSGSAPTERKPEDVVVGTQLGMDWAVSMAREGNLRICALPFEKGQRPYDKPIRPWKITRLAWSSWWRERQARS